MKFPASVINKDQYLTKIAQLLDDQECKIFIDTNILTMCFKMFDEARVEFFNWITPAIDNDRIKTPTWVLNEYTNHFKNKRTNEYFSALNKFKTLTKDYDEIKKFIILNTNDGKLRGTQYPSTDLLITDLNYLSELLNKVQATTKTNDLPYIINVHNELLNKFERTVLKSNIFNLINEINQEEESRFAYSLPPGFKDKDKELNKAGDLIIWKEILNFCEYAGLKKVILLSNDSKKDWTYAPLQITDRTMGRAKNNGDPEFKIADSRLIYEFWLRTNSEEFYIINFETLAKILIQKGIPSFNLSRALQIANSIERNINQSSINEQGSEEELLPYTSEEAAVEESLAIEIKTDIAETPTTSADQLANGSLSTFQFSSNALSDINFVPNYNSEVSSIIADLKSYNWYSQNSAIERFFLLKTIKEIESNIDRDALFVLGRNIYQAACGGAYSSIDIVKNASNGLASYSQKVSNFIFAGMFYEVYFNGQNEFRANNFKSEFVDELYALQTNINFKQAISFIENALEPYSLLVKPNNNPTDLEFKIKYRTVDEGYVTVNLIESIMCNEKELLMVKVNIYNSFYGDLAELKSKLKYQLAVPTNQIVLILEKSEIMIYKIPDDKEIGIPQLSIEH